MPVIRFDQLRSPEHISLTWGVAVEDLDTIEKASDLSGHYRVILIPKRGKKNAGKYRTVFKAEWGVLRQLQKNIARDVGETASFPECVQGFVRGRSAISNARLHLERRAILHADIEDFFDTIRFDQVVNAFVSLGCEDRLAGLLAKVCTLNGRLPQGASTSPVLANLVCAALDTELMRLASTSHARYSRYADDLVFSGDGLPDIGAVRRVLLSHGFTLREDKVRTQWKGKSQYVTGLSVADPAGPRVPLKAKRRLRLELYYAAKYGIDGHQERVGNDWSEGRLRQHWQGWIDYLNSVPGERPVAEWLAARLAMLRSRPKAAPRSGLTADATSGAEDSDGSSGHDAARRGSA